MVVYFLHQLRNKMEQPNFCLNSSTPSVLKYMTPLTSCCNFDHYYLLNKFTNVKCISLCLLSNVIWIKIASLSICKIIYKKDE
jgi:hypothetical protein